MWNLNLFPTIVWNARIREASSNGVFFDLSCAVNIKTTIDTTEIKEITCWNGESVIMEKPKANITMKISKSKNPDLLWQLYNLAVTSVTSWAKTITNSPQTFSSNDKIEMLERSSDALGITTITVKSAITGWTTYSLTTDYTVSIVDWKTTITRVTGGTIPSGATVYISWTYNTSAYKELEIKRKQRTKKQFSLEIFWQDETTLKYTSIYASPVTLNSTYLLEMIDMFRDWDIAGAELTFELMDMWSLKLRDENI